MFEQPLYNQEPVATPQQAGDLFHNYEIKNWILTPRIVKILAISAVGNVLAILLVAQTSLITMKGCDSPLVGSVCQVLDTVYVGSMLFGTDREYIDEVYEHTDLGDADITFVDVTGVTPPLSYPAGYFQVANPETAMFNAMSMDDLGNMTSPGIAPGIPYTSPSTGGSLIDTKPNYPQQKENVVAGDLPSGFDNSSTSAGNPTVANPIFRRQKGPRPGKVKNPSANPANPTDEGGPTVAIKPTPEDTTPKTDPKVDPTGPVDPNAINNRPLVDLSNYVNDLIDKNQYRLDSQFSISAKGKLNKDGKFDKGSFKIVKAESSDKTTIEVLKTTIEAINDSGRLKILEDLTGKDLSLTLSQDATALNAVLESDLETDMRANSIKSNLDLAIALAKKEKSGPGADQNDKDDLVLLENAKIEVVGKKVILRFLAPKEILLPMIQRKLAEEKAKPKQPNGTAPVRPLNNTAKK